jgi:hypothetical protein
MWCRIVLAWLPASIGNGTTAIGSCPSVGAAVCGLNLGQCRQWIVKLGRCSSASEKGMVTSAEKTPWATSDPWPVAFYVG